MRTALAVALALAVIGCKKPPEAEGPAPSDFEWAHTSLDGKFEIHQKRDGSACTVQVVSLTDRRALWTWQSCLAAPSGLVFLSPGADKALVLELFPSGGGAQTPDWSKVPLASLWTGGVGSPRQYTGAELLAGNRVRDMRSVLSWLKGETYDEIKASARLTANGANVTADLVDGRTVVFGFDGAALPAPPAGTPAVAAAAAEPPPAPPPAVKPRTAEPEETSIHPRPAAATADAVGRDEQGLYRWEDAQGGLHFSVGSQIPPQFRKRAVPVSAKVGVVPMDFPKGSPAKEGQKEGQPPAPAGQPAPEGKPVTAAPPAGGTPAAGTPK